MTHEEYREWAQMWLVGAALKCSDGEQSIVKERAMRLGLKAANALMRKFTEDCAAGTYHGRRKISVLIGLLDRTARGVHAAQRDQESLEASAEALGYTDAFHTFLTALRERERTVGPYQVQVRFLYPRDGWGPTFRVLGTACDNSRQYHLVLLDLTDGKKRTIRAHEVAELEFVELEGATA